MEGNSWTHYTSPLSLPLSLHPSLLLLSQNHLLCCLQQCVARFAEWEDRDEGAEGETHTPEVIEDARDTLQSLAERMAKSEPEDFELVRLCMVLNWVEK